MHGNVIDSVCVCVCVMCRSVCACKCEEFMWICKWVGYVWM